MKKFTLTFLSLCFLSFAFSQKNIQNSITEAHQQIKGTKFFIVPPEGFFPANGQAGYQDSSLTSSIVAIHIPGPFSETTAGFGKEALASSGVILKKKETITVNGYDGIKIRGEQVAYGITFSKFILVFGDEKGTYMLNGAYPKEEKSKGKTIVESIMTVVYDDQQEIDPLAAAPFSIETTGTKLQFALSMSGALIYTTDGKVPTESPDKTRFIVALSNAAVPVMDKRATAIRRLKQMGHINLELDDDDITEVTLDGLEGYKIITEGDDGTTSVHELIYQIMVFMEDGRYYIMVGGAEADFEANTELFEKLASSFKQQ